VTQFAFLEREWVTVFESASKAEAAVHADPRTACFYARRALELAVGWAYKHDAALKLPYQDNLSALIHDPSFKEAAGEAVFSKARVINTLGNRAVHGHRAIPLDDAIVAVRELLLARVFIVKLAGSSRHARNRSIARRTRRAYSFSDAGLKSFARLLLKRLVTASMSSWLKSALSASVRIPRTFREATARACAVVAGISPRSEACPRNSSRSSVEYAFFIAPLRCYIVLPT